MEKLKAIIIDDESDAVDSLNIIMNEFCDEDVEVVGKAHSALEGIKEINCKNPDLVFLDIEMPGGTGFEMLESFDNINFNVVFITAYNHYAIKAFKFKAKDYLLKPADIDDITAVVKKIKGRNGNNNKNIDLTKFIKEIYPNSLSKKIQIPVGSNIEFIDLNKLIRVEADGSYTKLIIENSNDLYVSKKMHEIERLLPETGFFKPHKSHMINLDHVVKFNKSDNSIIMSDKAIVRLARKQKDSFFDIMNL